MNPRDALSDPLNAGDIELPFVVWLPGEPFPEAARHYIDPIIIDVSSLPDGLKPPLRHPDRAERTAIANLTNASRSVPRVFTDIEQISWTKDFDHACRTLRVDRNQASRALHELKEAIGLGGADNVIIHLPSGDLYWGDECIGNLRD